MQLVCLDKGEELFQIGKRVEHIYFPTTALISVSKDLSDGLSIDTALVGKNSAVGLLLLDVDVSINRAYVQSAGFAYRVSKIALLNEVRCGNSLFEIWMTAIRFLSNQLSQNIACNRFHNIHQRTARWLLMTADSLEDNLIPVTHTYLASSIGVRREAISLSIAKMNALGIIRCSRGFIEIANREMLKAMSCECYFTLRRLMPFSRDVVIK